MKGERHFSRIGREAGVGGQNIEHFMSESPWSGEAVCRQVQDELKVRPELLLGGVVLVDESADEKAGDHSSVPGETRVGHPATSRQAWPQALTNPGIVWGSGAGRQPVREADRAPHPGQNDGARRIVRTLCRLPGVDGA
jgi:hypothetical protein